MKKLAFFIPAIVFTLFYGAAALAAIGSIHPVIAAWLALFWLAGVFLCKGKFWGGVFGVIPAACFIYMGTQNTGQIIRETPIGIVVFIYYAVCMYFVYTKHRSKSL